MIFGVFASWFLMLFNILDILDSPLWFQMLPAAIGGLFFNPFDDGFS